MKKMKEYKGFKYICTLDSAEKALIKYIDSITEGVDTLEEIPDASEENYNNWHCDYDFAGVEMLVLPSSVKRIGKCAFAQSRIQNIVAPGVVVIDELAFYNTKHLVSVDAPECEYLSTTDPDNPHEFTEGSDAFNHSHVRKLNLPKVKRVGRYAFYDMPYLETLSLPSCEELYPHAVYGNEQLKQIKLGKSGRAQCSAICNNPQLKSFKGSFDEVHSDWFFNNGIERPALSPSCRVITDRVEKNDILPLETDIVDKSQSRETFNYTYEYKGFKFNLVADCEGQEQEIVERIKACIDEWCEWHIIDSPNQHADESAEDALKYVKDIYIPESILGLADYSFAKCYGLESIVAANVRLVGDHAFYCDGQLRYVQLDNCVEFADDAFNGAAYDYSEVAEDTPVAKLIAPNVKKVGSHCFWQAGYRVVHLPNATEVESLAFDENPALQVVTLGKVDKPYTFERNLQLRKVNALGAQRKGVVSDSPLFDSAMVM